MYGVKVKYNITDKGFSALWEGVKKVLPVLNSVPCSELPSARTLKRTALRDVPMPLLEVSFENKVTNELQREVNLSSYPKKKYEDREIWKPVTEIWRHKLEDIDAFHRHLHGGEETTRGIVLNIDGVPIGRTGRSQIIVSVKFTTCRNVYHIVNAVGYESSRKKDLSVPVLLGDVFEAMKRLNMSLEYISADAPMRAVLRNQKNHAARLGCDYCYGEARHKTRPIWGIRTLDAPLRTLERLRQDYEEHDTKGTPLARFGYNGKCLILKYLPHFNVIRDIPVDPFHLLYLGIARAFFELIFRVGEKRAVNTPHIPRVDVKGLSGLLLQIKVPSEIGRRPRPVDFRNWKGVEWRNIVLFYLPAVMAALPAGSRRRLWIEYTYLCRAYSLDDDEFSGLHQSDLDELAKAWYVRYNDEFGNDNMRYNIHMVPHLSLIRVHGPFPTISAFIFEGSFAASNRAQRVGTTSLGLQDLLHSCLRPLRGHTCKKSVRYKSKSTARSNDGLIYTSDGLYKIAEDPLEGDENVKALRLTTTTFFCPEGSGLDFAAVGIVKEMAVSSRVINIAKSDIRGKVVRVPFDGDAILIKVSNNLLREAD